MNTTADAADAAFSYACPPTPAILPVYVSPSDRGLLQSLGFPSPSTMFEAIKRGDLPAFKIGRSTVVKTMDVMAWIESTPRTDNNRSSKGRKPRTS